MKNKEQKLKGHSPFKINNLAKKYDLDLLLLFGSRASGRFHQESDFDVAYLSSKDLDLLDESQMIVDLAPLFKSENIDLVNLKHAPPLLFYGIFESPKIIYENEKKPLVFDSMRAYAFKKYIETKPLYEEKFKKLKARLNV